MSLFAHIQQMKKMIQNLDRWLEKASAHAGARKFDANVLVVARLAPDMYPLSRQVQAACDGLKFAAARLTGKEPPAHPDTETTITDLRARCAKVVAYVDGLTESDFAGAEERKVTVPYLPGKYSLGADYFREQAFPNFMFHTTMAYALLRHNGVEIGKRDYIGAVTLHDLA